MLVRKKVTSPKTMREMTDRTIEEMLKAKQFINRALNGVAKAANFNDQGKKLKYDG